MAEQPRQQQRGETQQPQILSSLSLLEQRTASEMGGRGRLEGDSNAPNQAGPMTLEPQMDQAESSMFNIVTKNQMLNMAHQQKFVSPATHNGKVKAQALMMTAHQSEHHSVRQPKLLVGNLHSREFRKKLGLAMKEQITATDKILNMAMKQTRLKQQATQQQKRTKPYKFSEEKMTKYPELRHENRNKIIGSLIARQVATGRIANTLLNENLKLKTPNLDRDMQLVIKQDKQESSLETTSRKEASSRRLPSKRLMSALPASKKSTAFYTSTGVPIGVSASQKQIKEKKTIQQYRSDPAKVPKAAQSTSMFKSNPKLAAVAESKSAKVSPSRKAIQKNQKQKLATQRSSLNSKAALASTWNRNIGEPVKPTNIILNVPSSEELKSEAALSIVNADRYLSPVNVSSGQEDVRAMANTTSKKRFKVRIPRVTSATRAQQRERKVFQTAIEVVKYGKIFERPDLSSQAISLLPKGHTLLTTHQLVPLELQVPAMGRGGVDQQYTTGDTFIKVFDERTGCQGYMLRKFVAEPRTKKNEPVNLRTRTWRNDSASHKNLVLNSRNATLSQTQTNFNSSSGLGEDGLVEQAESRNSQTMIRFSVPPSNSQSQLSQKRIEILEKANGCSQDQTRLFSRYDKDRKLREFQEAIGDDSEFLQGPIRRNFVPLSAIERIKDEVYGRICDIRASHQNVAMSSSFFHPDNEQTNQTQ